MGIGKHLGIGLISIRREDSGFVCHEVLEPSTNAPIQKLRDLASERKRIFACQLCKTIKEGNSTKTVYPLDKMPNWSQNEVKKGKDLLIENKDKKEFYCNRCARIKLNLI